MIVLSSYVFAIVMVVLAYAIWKFRAKPGDESDGEPIHGNTRLEIIWTVIPTIIVICSAASTAGSCSTTSRRRRRNAMPLDVTAQQYEWTFEYPDAGQDLATSSTCRSTRQLDFS